MDSGNYRAGFRLVALRRQRGAGGLALDLQFPVKSRCYGNHRSGFLNFVANLEELQRLIAFRAPSVSMIKESKGTGKRALSVRGGGWRDQFPPEEHKMSGSI